jgi:hypothetical protein
LKPELSSLAAKAMSLFLLGLIRLLTGAQARWYGCPPKAEQRIYFANHQSHADLVLIWAALPQELRGITRPIAARDYWTKTPFKQWITTAVFNAIYVDRERKADEDPLQPLIDALTRATPSSCFPRARAAMPRSRSRSRPACTTWRCVFRRGAGAGLDQQRAAGHAQGRGGAGAGVVFGHLWRADDGWRRARSAAPSSTARAGRDRAAGGLRRRP